MSLETEAVLDRRRMKRATSMWRVLAIIGLVAAVGAIVFSGARGLGLTKPKQIARVTISGLITEDRAQLRMLKQIEEADHVAGVLLAVNSAGGTTTGGEAIYEGLRSLAKKKPVVAQFGTVAASAAYIAGLGTDHIVARGNSITGSVGVIMQWPEVSELLGKIGVKMNEIKSGPLKAEPSPFHPLNEGGRQVTEEMIREGQQWFLGLVRARRKIDTAAVPGLEQGRVFSGREAKRLGLVDEIGGEAEAIRWLEQQRKVPKNLKVVDWAPRRSSSWSFISALSLTGTSGIVSEVREAVGEVLAGAGLAAIRLDGLVSVWQPSKN
ncbi:MAG: signal peptide peptidase SppA [Hyphomicrobiaceae bacterium]